MGRLVDQDYLWLRESASATTGSARRRWLPFTLVPVAALGVWLIFYTQGDRPADPERAADARNTSSHRLAIWPNRSMTANRVPNANVAAVQPVNFLMPRALGTRRLARPANDSPALTMAPAATLTADANGWRRLVIQRGDTLSLAFQRQGLSYMDSLRIAHLPRLGSFFTSGLNPGATLRVKTDSDGRVDELVYPVDAQRTITLTRHGDQFSARLVEQPLDHRPNYVSGLIRHSFYADARAAGLAPGQIATVHRVFDQGVDFKNDLQTGDRFVVAYDTLYRDGRRVGTGPILAAAITHDGHTTEAVRYTDRSGTAKYYRPNGRPLQPAFVRAPVRYTRISSPFNMQRMHPILHRMRPHEGTDYAAAEGTPIHATGAGQIIFQGRDGGYGNLVIIRHDAHITMRFAHILRFARGQSVGDRVAEGQVIGYVGMTGMATGPHVHYEFRIDGKPHNPQTVRLPGAAPLTGTALARFKRRSASLIAAIDRALDARPAQLARLSRAAND